MPTDYNLCLCGKVKTDTTIRIQCKQLGFEAKLIQHLISKQECYSLGSQKEVTSIWVSASRSFYGLFSGN